MDGAPPPNSLEARLQQTEARLAALERCVATHGRCLGKVADILEMLRDIARRGTRRWFGWTFN